LLGVLGGSKSLPAEGIADDGRSLKAGALRTHAKGTSRDRNAENCCGKDEDKAGLIES
jgi:hypothetical protein